MEKSTSGLKRQLSRAANSIREGLGEYLGINEETETTTSFYVPTTTTNYTPNPDEPYWMKENYWANQDDNNANGQRFDGVTVIPNTGYGDAPPPYSEAPPSYSAQFSSMPPGTEMQAMGGVNTASYYPDGAQPMHSDPMTGGGRGRGGGATSRTLKKVAPPPTYRPYFIIAVSIIDLILIVWEIIENHGFEPWSQNPWFGPSATVLLDAGAKYTPLILDGEWWRFFTPIFLHVGLGHILMNMLTQLRVGVALERSYGPHRIAPIYFLCGVMGNLSSAIMLPKQIQVGASGSLFGFTGVLLADLLQNWTLIQNPVRNLFSLLFSASISLVLGLVLPGVDNFAHIGGLIMGVLTGFVFLPSLNPARSAQKGRLKTVIVSGSLAIAIFIALFSVFYRQIPASQWCKGCQYITCLHSLKWCQTGQ